MAQISYLSYPRGAFTAYRDMPTVYKEALLPPIAIIDDYANDDSDEFNSDDERGVFLRHKHRRLFERERAPSPEVLHYSQKAQLNLLHPTKKSEKSRPPVLGINTNIKWDYAHGPLSPLSDLDESDDDSESERHHSVPVAEDPSGDIAKFQNSGTEAEFLTKSAAKGLKRKRSSDSFSPPCDSDSPSKRQRRASDGRDGSGPKRNNSDRKVHTNTRQLRSLRPVAQLHNLGYEERRANGNEGQSQSEAVHQDVTRKISTKKARKVSVFGKIRRPRF